MNHNILQQSDIFFKIVQCITIFYNNIFRRDVVSTLNFDNDTAVFTILM